MAKRRKVVDISSDDSPKSEIRPATTPEARENQLISLAVDLAEQQLRDGSASSQVITHFLKLGSTREQAELEKLKRENALLKAKTDMIESTARTEELYTKALSAMKSYGVSQTDTGDDDVQIADI